MSFLDMPDSKPPIYLDSHATTPVDPRVVDAMLPYFTSIFGNSSSLDHMFGHDASEAVKKARADIAGAINADSSDVIFMSGATESDNLALTGVMLKSKKNHLITCQTEHKAVLDTAKNLESQGIHVTYLPVDEFGLIDTEQLIDVISDDTALISVMFANNEIGTIQDIAEIGKIAHENNVLFHTDAAQAVGHIPIDVQKLNIDLMSFSSHKIYGPKGIGALYMRGIMPRVKVAPIIHGGGQEKNVRSGTLNVPGIVGFAKAVSIAQREMDAENIRFRHWSKQMLDELFVVDAKLNGHPTRRLFHNLNIRFEGIDGKAIINSVSKMLAISAGSACTTQMVEPSHVLLALGLTEKQAHSSIRIGCGRFNTDEEIKIATYEISECISSLTRIQI